MHRRIVEGGSDVVTLVPMLSSMMLVDFGLRFSGEAVLLWEVGLV